MSDRRCREEAGLKFSEGLEGFLRKGTTLPVVFFPGKVAEVGGSLVVVPVVGSEEVAHAQELSNLLD